MPPTDTGANPFAGLAAQKKKAAEEKAKRDKLTPEERAAANKAAVSGMNTEIPSDVGSETYYDAQGRQQTRKIMKSVSPSKKVSPAKKTASLK